MGIIGCEKDHQLDPPDIQVTVPDSVEQITSVDTFYAPPYWNYPVPSSNGESGIKTFDVNSDGTDDLKIEVNYEYHFLSASSPGGNYQIWKLIGRVNGTEVPCCDGWFGGNGLPRAFGGMEKIIYGEELLVSDLWGGRYAMYYGSFTWAVPEVPDYYVFFRIPLGQDHQYGWIHLLEDRTSLTVLEYAVNFTPNQPIWAGQTE